MNYLSKENKAKYLPNHYVRNVHNAIMPDTKCYGYWEVNFSYNKLEDDLFITTGGEDIDKVWVSSQSFTRKLDALKFVKLVNKGA